MPDSEPNHDAYTPREIARRVHSIGVIKATMPALPMLLLAILAGAFIAYGAMFFTLVVTDSALGFGITRLLGGLAFSTGLVLVIVGGAELFTGNNLIAMAWASGEVTTGRLLRSWALVYAGNLVGSLGSAVFVWLSGTLHLADGSIAATAVSIASAKVALPFGEAFVRGILCNALVCLAVWMCFAARSVADRILAIVFPISAFVALGFEHSVANMYLIPVGMLAARDLGIDNEALDLAGFLGNLVPVTLGNLLGGSILVALVYWLIYVRAQGRGMGHG
jgi:formate/nitrite transporter